MKVSQIVNHFGGLSRLSKAHETLTPQMIHMWRERNSIPSKQIPALVRFAKSEGVDLDYSDFIENDK